MRWRSLSMIPALLVAVAALAAGPQPFTLTSNAFGRGQPIPARFTCDGLSQSPSLVWTDPPPRAKSIALVVDDPDAPRGTFTHWLIWNLAPASFALPDGVNRHREGIGDAEQGTNDFGKEGYGPPCPPPGKAHHYFFRVLALSAPLELEAKADRAAFDKALKKVKVLGVAEFVGTYARAK